MRPWLLLLLLGLMSACQSASSDYSGSHLVTPVGSGATDSFFPDGPTAGYELQDDLEFSPGGGIHARFQRVDDLKKLPVNPYGNQISLIEDGKTVLSSGRVGCFGSSDGGGWVYAWIEGNPRATMYRISSPGYSKGLERQFPLGASGIPVIQLKRLGSTRYAWRCQGWCMAINISVSLDGGKTWQRTGPPPQTAFDLKTLPRSFGKPVMLDIRAAQPGHYWFARYELP